MKKTIIATALAASLMALAPASYAGFVNFNDLTPVGTAQKHLGTISTGGLTASGGPTVTVTGVTAGILTIANFGDELGLGVCSSDDLTKGICQSTDFDTPESGWQGTWDELDNLNMIDEFITITEAGAEMTGQFKLGSFDNTEAGNVTYDNNGTTKTVSFIRNSTGASILSDDAGGSSIVQSSGDPGNVFLFDDRQFRQLDRECNVQGRGVWSRNRLQR